MHTSNVKRVRASDLIFSVHLGSHRTCHRGRRWIGHYERPVFLIVLHLNIIYFSVDQQFIISRETWETSWGGQCPAEGKVMVIVWIGYHFLPFQCDTPLPWRAVISRGSWRRQSSLGAAIESSNPVSSLLWYFFFFCFSSILLFVWQHWTAIFLPTPSYLTQLHASISHWVPSIRLPVALPPPTDRGKRKERANKRAFKRQLMLAAWCSSPLEPVKFTSPCKKICSVEG